MRIGTGYDVHKLVENRKLILGGVEIPYEKGLLGHSDADVLVHAIMDALLGAAALGDIGLHFPDNDPVYKGADSLRLARRVSEILAENGYLIENVDSTVIAQAPKLRPYIDRMRDDRGTSRIYRARRRHLCPGSRPHHIAPRPHCPRSRPWCRSGCSGHARRLFSLSHAAAGRAEQ